MHLGRTSVRRDCTAEIHDNGCKEKNKDGKVITTCYCRGTYCNSAPITLFVPANFILSMFYFHCLM